jgi:hypothetical protein
MEASGQLHAPAALPPGKEPPAPIGQEAGRVPEPKYTETELTLLVNVISLDFNAPVPAFHKFLNLKKSILVSSLTSSAPRQFLKRNLGVSLRTGE